MATEKIGFELIADILGGAGADVVSGDATGANAAVDANHARAIGVDNSDAGVDPNSFLIDLNGGNDTVKGAAEATSNTGQAFADGIRNQGVIRLDGGLDQIIGEATATTLANGEITFAAGINSTAGGQIRGDADADLFKGTATASGTDNSQVEAHGIVLTDAVAGGGNDEVTGTATATGGNLATANGIRVGTFEDNTVAVVGGEPLPNEAGTFNAGNGNDTITGTATATTTSDGINVLFNDVNGVLVDVASTLTTGDGADKITGRAKTIDNGVGGGNFLTLNALSADGVEVRGDLSTGGGADIIKGAGVGEATNSFVVVEGIDFGLGNNLNAALGGNPNLVNVTPIVNLGGGADQIIGTATSTVEGADAATITAGIQSVGTIIAGSGNDTLRGTATSTVVGGGNGIDVDGDGIEDIANRGAVADGIQNFVINEALGVDQDGTINLGAGNDVIEAEATATITDFSAFATGLAGGIFRAGDGNDRISGTATASGIDDVAATGVLFVDASTTANAVTVDNDVIIGNATSFGSAATDARGISNGLSDIDDDSIQNPQDTDAAQAAQVGSLVTGAGDDQFIATAFATADADLGFGDLFFANATGITNDGGTLAQLTELLIAAGFVDDQGNVIINRESVEAVIADLDVGTLDTGAGNDSMVTTADVTVTGGVQGVNGGDEDLEVFVEGVENSGLMTFGAGDDSIVANITGRAEGAAKILAEGVDNSGVGVSTGLDLENDNANTIMNFGAGNDSITVRTNVLGIGDLAAGDGIDNRGNLLMGAGNDTIDVEAISEFRRDLVTPGDQEEGIADGIENRLNVLLGLGNDTVKAKVKATGNGILTIAEAVESRSFFDAGAGHDSFILDATAITKEGVLAENLTQAAGLQLEQITSGELQLRGGDDSIVASGTAQGRDNNATLAFGITQVTADATAANDAGLLHAGGGNNTLKGTATASGFDNSQVEAHGILLTNAVAGDGNDKFNGKAKVKAENLATANGIRIGVLEDNPVGFTGVEPLPTEAGSLNAGGGLNTITGAAEATTKSDGKSFFFSDVNGVLVDKDSTLKTGGAVDKITGSATLIDKGVGGGVFGGNDPNNFTLSSASADGIEARGDIFTGGGADVFKGKSVAEVTNTFVVAEGIDFGLGSTQNGIAVTPIIETGAGADRLIGTAKSTAVGNEAASITAGIQTQGKLNTGDGADLIQADSSSTVIGGANGIRGTISDGFENRDTVITGNGADTILVKRAVATADKSRAEANGVRNGIVALQGGVGGVSGDAAGLINMGAGNDRIEANAFATSEVAALASGIAIDGVGSALLTGNGIDVVIGNGTADATGRALVDIDANGIFVGVGGTFNTDGDADTITGVAEASGTGASTDPTEFAVLTDGIENKGLFQTGGGADVISGTGVSFGDGVEATAGGIDNGRALMEQDSFIAPDFLTAGGDDVITADAQATAINNAAVTDALSNVGQFLTDGGADKITATATSKASGVAGDRAVADAIDNRKLFSTGALNDEIVALATASAVNGNASANAIDQNEELGSVINLGSGADCIAAEANAFSTNGTVDAIALLGGTINAGAGNDVIEARSNDNLIGNSGISLDGGRGFGAGVNINMQGDDDTLLGFGEATANGGAGIDTLQFEFSLREFAFGGGSINFATVEVDFTFAGVTLQTDNFENFEFNASPTKLSGVSSVSPDSVVETFNGPEELQVAFDLAQQEAQLLSTQQTALV